VADESSNIERDLAARGFTADERTSIGRQVITAVTNVLQDARGRWLFDAQHRSLQSEFALTTRRDDASFAHYVLDRTFVDNRDVRWIVDFKLSTHAGGGLEAFLASEQARYRPQLEEYARVMRTMDARPIRLGLYFPALAAWREWDYAG
jgi:ATP-dependent helicase/nuclease subunit A